jgi:glycerophosphoryl diester phosphodiesterase
MQTREVSLTRRGFMALAATAVAAGCGRQPAPEVTRTPSTVSTLLADNPFYVAHRGGGGDWPEMTAYAYAQATKIPSLKALEISVCLTSDGVLVCSHDPTTTRVTGLPYTIAKHDWKTLSALKVLGTNTTDPNQPARYFTRFDEVFEAYSRDYVLFIEPKATEAVEPLRKLLVARAQPERVVWKHWITSPDFEFAHRHGFTTWAYVLNQPSHIGANLERYAASPNIDLLGAPRDQSDAFCGAVVDAARRNGKNSMMWNIRNDEDRTRALSLGCRGLMTSHVKELMGY